MEKYEIKSEVIIYHDDELTPEDRELVDAAKEATKMSYSPYSGFSVGAAIRLADGTIFTGSNQENASYSLSLCAERTAIFAAQHQHPELSVKAIAIAARNKREFLEAPIPPCGACRQVMLEIEDRYNQPMRVLLYGTKGVHAVNTVKDILPFQFVGKNME